MADIHVLTGGNRGDVLVAMHFAVPDQDNSVGVKYRTALVNSQIGGSTRLPEGCGPGQIAAAEKTQVENGEVHEYVCSFPIGSGGAAAAELRASLRALYTARKQSVLTTLQDRLRWFGHEESEELGS